MSTVPVCRAPVLSLSPCPSPPSCAQPQFSDLLLHHFPASPPVITPPMQSRSRASARFSSFSACFCADERDWNTAACQHAILPGQRLHLPGLLTRDPPPASLPGSPSRSCVLFRWGREKQLEIFPCSICHLSPLLLSCCDLWGASAALPSKGPCQHRVFSKESFPAACKYPVILRSLKNRQQPKPSPLTLLSSGS